MAQAICSHILANQISLFLVDAGQLPPIYGAACVIAYYLCSASFINMYPWIPLKHVLSIKVINRIQLKSLRKFCTISALQFCQRLCLR